MEKQVKKKGREIKLPIENFLALIDFGDWCAVGGHKMMEVSEPEVCVLGASYDTDSDELKIRTRRHTFKLPSTVVIIRRSVCEIEICYICAKALRLVNLNKSFRDFAVLDPAAQRKV